MNILVVLGSSRENSRSLKVVNAILEGAKTKKCNIKIYNLNEIELKGCIGCGCCRKNSIDCVIDDGLKDYFNDLHNCDVLIISGANYYSMPCGQMITYMNRHYCLTDSNKNNRLKPGKQLISVFSQGAPENYPKYVPHYEWFINTFVSKGIELLSSINIGGNTDLSDDGEVIKDSVILGKSL